MCIFVILLFLVQSPVRIAHVSSLLAALLSQIHAVASIACIVSCIPMTSHKRPIPVKNSGDRGDRYFKRPGHWLRANDSRLDAARGEGVKKCWPSSRVLSLCRAGCERGFRHGQPYQLAQVLGRGGEQELL